jgi:hypothetical protein
VQAPAGLVARLLITGTALVIFDGLDELLDTGHRAEVTAIVERFCTEYPLAPVLVTSRLVGYEVPGLRSNPPMSTGSALTCCSAGGTRSVTSTWACG